MIKVSKTWLSNGTAKTSISHISSHGSFSAFKKAAKASAEQLAANKGGRVEYCEDKCSLFINYMGVKGTRKIDTCYMLV